jgi:hypothetical protein
MTETTHDPLASFPGYPRGWFVIQFSDELGRGDVKPLRYFGKDLVLFRTESGKPAILDAYCPHLGAHLGHGGKVARPSAARSTRGSSTQRARARPSPTRRRSPRRRRSIRGTSRRRTG